MTPTPYVLVPQRPTSAMGEAALHWQRTEYVYYSFDSPHRFYFGIYRAMLAAAPAAPPVEHQKEQPQTVCPAPEQSPASCEGATAVGEGDGAPDLDPIIDRHKNRPYPSRAAFGAESAPAEAVSDAAVEVIARELYAVEEESLEGGIGADWTEITLGQHQHWMDRARKSLNAAFPALLADNARWVKQIETLNHAVNHNYGRFTEEFAKREAAEAKLAASEAALRDAREDYEKNLLWAMSYRLVVDTRPEEFLFDTADGFRVRYSRVEVQAIESPADAALAQEQPHAAQQEGRNA
jgi:hypothetical protein